VASGNPITLYAGGVSTGLYRSTDGGQTWKQTNNGLELIPGAALRVTALAVDEANSRRVVAATTYGIGNRFGPGSVYESSDSGRSWVKVADTEAMVTQLILDQRGIYVATGSGLAFYGEQVETESALPQLRSLTELSGTQILILALTLALAGLALVGRGEWVLNKKTQPT
jgi:hypothetical protein